MTHLAVVDVGIPGDGQPDIGQAGRRWHYTFLQTLDLPEAVIGGGRDHLFFDWFCANYGPFPDAVSPEAGAESTLPQLPACLRSVEKASSSELKKFSRLRFKA